MTHSALPSALLVIDVQQSFMHMPFWTDAQLPRFQSALLALDAGCRAAQAPVVHVFHTGLEGPFQAESGLVKPMARIVNVDACLSSL